MKERYSAWLRLYVDDVLVLIGCVCILIGLAMLSAIVTWIAAGLMMCAWGLVIGRSKASRYEDLEEKQ